MKKQYIFLAFYCTFSLIACKNDNHSNLDDGLYANINTNYGDFLAELYFKEAPMTVANFVSLAEGSNPKVSEKYQGKKFFDSLVFHRVVDGFVIQGGDPNGDGEGGPGYEFPNEVNKTLSHGSKGVFSMANAGPDTNGSQFFITLAPRPDLDGGYSVFGQTVEGQEIIDSIGKVEVDTMDKPKEDVYIKTVEIIRKGKEANDFDAPKVFEEEIEKRDAEEKADQEKIQKELDELAEGYKETDSGLRYKIEKENPDGEKPRKGQTVHVYYKGMLQDSKVFDERSKEEGEDPISFEVGIGRVIPGWDEGLQLIREGEEARLIIPPHLGYGPAGVGPIPENAILIFDVTLDKIED